MDCSDNQWSSLTGIYTADDADFMAQLLGTSSFPSFNTDHLLASHNLNNFHMEDLCVGDYMTTTFGLQLEDTPTHHESYLVPTPRKRPRDSSHHHDEKSKSVKAKPAKKNKVASSSSNDENVVSTSWSEDDDINGGMSSSLTLTSKGKARASRGSATDPQSLYARKRREKINERLKILQNIVPNGTKVDISTMLEEAVQYVKFLQLQIKLLSSNELWMYSPIAYNGMDLGLNNQIHTSKTS